MKILGAFIILMNTIGLAVLQGLEAWRWGTVSAVMSMPSVMILAGLGLALAVFSLAPDHPKRANNHH